MATKCRSRAMVQATPRGAANTATKISGMITAKTYATRCGRCTAGRDAATGWAGVAGKACDSCGGGHLGSTLDMRQGPEVAVHVPGGESGRDTAGLLCHMIRHLTCFAPAALEQGTKQGQGFGNEPRCSSRAAALTYNTAPGSGECPVRPADTTARAIGKRWRVAGHDERSQHVGVQDQHCSAWAIRSAAVDRA